MSSWDIDHRENEADASEKDAVWFEGDVHRLDSVIKMSLVLRVL